MVLREAGGPARQRVAGALSDSAWSQSHHQHPSLNKTALKEGLPALLFAFRFVYYLFFGQLCGKWDLSSLTRNGTHTPGIEAVLTTGQPGKFPSSAL